MLARCVRAFAVIAAFLVRDPAALGQVVPLGPELQVNTYTTGDNKNPEVASDANGNFVVVWTNYDGSAGSDSSYGSVQLQRFSASGALAGPEFQVNSYTTGGQRDPSIALDALGNSVVVWWSDGSAGSDTDGRSIQGRRFDSTGAPLGNEFQINSYTTGDQLRPAVASDPAGNFVVVWTSDGSEGSDTDDSSVQGQRYSAAGTPLGTEFQVNTYTTNGQSTSDVAADSAGNFVVTWMSYGSMGSDTDGPSVQARRFDAAGIPAGAEFQVNSYTTGLQFPGGIAAAAGNFVVAWASGSFVDGGPDYLNVHARRFDNTGAPLGNEFQVNTFTTHVQLTPSVASDASGRFVVAWMNHHNDGYHDQGIEGQLYDSTGSPLGGEFRVNTFQPSYQFRPNVASDSAGNFVVVWESYGSPGTDDDSSYSVQLQRFAASRPILGKSAVVRDPAGIESSRELVVLAKETATDIGPSILGDPTATGATLRVTVHGTTNSDQTYALGASGWSAIGSAGYKYFGPTDVDGDPVKKVLVKRTAGGTALLKVILEGSIGTQSLDVVPPNLGDDGGITLTIPGGGTYCATFGGAAGGTEVRDDGQVWKVTNATAQGCQNVPPSGGVCDDDVMVCNP